MHVLFMDPLEDRLRDFPARYLPAPEFDVRLARPEGPTEEDLADAEVAIYWSFPVDAALIDRMPGLRLVQRVGWYRTAGDLSGAHDRGIYVSATPWGVLARVAQHTLALMLALARNIMPSHQAVLEKVNAIGMEPTYAMERPIAFNWSKTSGIESLYDRTLGIIGFGEAGSVLADLVKPMNMEVLYYKRRRLTPGLERHFGVEYADMDDLLRRSDYVATFVPYTKENLGLIGDREFRLMKPGAFFVNTGRANPTDEKALIQALQEGRLAGAGLDVFSHEPLPDDSLLRDLPNVILTPHVAGGVGGWEDSFQRFARNIRSVRAGKPPVCQLTADSLRP
ncbi:MAG: hypothetical protein IT307_15290 [Chloroflexi bacterium]|nr:hypothetical protein [Chloroflexota bacterium]